MEFSPSFWGLLSERKKEWIVGSLSVFAGMAILITYFQAGPTADVYAQAQAAFTKWEGSPADETLYSQMKEAIRKTPALQKKYEATIAQKLLQTKKIEEALEMANHSIDRVREEIPLHSQYAQTSLLIERGQYQQALEEAVSLKEKLNTEAPHSLLFAHNLLRIACLHQKLKNRPGEKAAWEELETFLQRSPYADLVLANFSNKKVDLTQYIADRKKAL